VKPIIILFHQLGKDSKENVLLQHLRDTEASMVQRSVLARFFVDHGEKPSSQSKADPIEGAVI
jgi:hypothetical protein